MFNLDYRQIPIESLKAGQELFYLTEHSNYIHKAHVLEIRKLNSLSKVQKNDDIDLDKPESFGNATIVKTIKIDDIEFYDIETHRCYISGNNVPFTRVLPDGYFLSEKELRNFIAKTEVKTIEIEIKK